MKTASQIGNSICRVGCQSCTDGPCPGNALYTITKLCWNLPGPPSESLSHCLTQADGNPESSYFHLCPPIFYSPVSESSLKSSHFSQPNPPLASHAAQGLQHSYWVLLSLPPDSSIYSSPIALYSFNSFLGHGIP